MATKITAAVITFNNERDIRDCLESVAWADEIVVVDSFSTDRTLEICHEYTDKVFQRPWPGFTDQWRHTMTLTSNSWVLSLDADERITPELRDEIGCLDLERGGVDCYLIPRRPFFMGRWINHSGWYPARIPRLFHKDRGEWGGVPPHGTFITRGKTAKLQHDILHYIGRNLTQYSITVLNYADVSAAAHREAGKAFAWHQITFRPVYTFVFKYFIRLGFLDGIPGLAYAALSAYGVFVKYVRLHDLEREQRR
jgi:glycosyltransferase involved in cell wall biosynthesis